MKAGELILFTSDRWSDFQIQGLYRVLKDFEPLAALDAQPTIYYDERLAHLERIGLLERVAYREVWLGQNGNLNPDLGKP